MLPPPHSARKNIPFYTAKSEQEFRADPYEDYATAVCRQLTLHYADHLHGGYPWQGLLDWLSNEIGEATTILEVGCGAGRLIGEVADAFPHADCYGFDYSYQLLKAAHDVWLGEKTLAWRYPRGYPEPLRQPARSRCDNLQFGLARACYLPFAADSLDLLYSTFLFDRLPDPAKALNEWQRVLKPGGKLLLASPLNFQQTRHWDDFHPVEKLRDHLQETGWENVSTLPELTLEEPLDVRGNKLVWKCALITATPSTWW